MAATTSGALAAPQFGTARHARVELKPTRSATAASWTSLAALILRDLVVLRKHKVEFTVRTLVQPFLLCFVFLYVFPKIGQGIGGASGSPERSRRSPRCSFRAWSDSPSCSRASRPWPCSWRRSSASPARSRTACRRRARSGWSPSPRSSPGGRRA